MQTFKVNNVLMVVMLCLFLFGAETSVGRTKEEIIAESKEKVSAERSYKLGTDIEFVLRKENAIRLICDDNDYGLKEYIIYYYTKGLNHRDIPGIIRADVYFDGGESSGGGSRTTSQGALRQAGYTPCLAIIKWRITDGKALIKFCVSTDKKRNHREYEKDRAQRERTGDGLYSIQFKDNQILPPLQLSEAERLAGFVRLWSEVKYNFAFFDQVPQLDWDGILLEYLPRVQQAESAEEYYRVLKQCVALLQDGHTSVWGPSGEPKCRLPVRIQAVEGKAAIVAVLPADDFDNSELIEELLKANLKVGEEITHIDGRSVQKILTEDIYPYIFASTPQGRDLKAYPEITRGEYGTKAVLSVRGLDGNVRDVTLTRGHYRMRPKREVFVCRELADGIVYVNLPGFGSETDVHDFDAVFNKISKAKGLILDVRENGGGSTRYGSAIISRLIDKPMRGSHWKTRQYIPAFRAWGREEEWYEGDHRTIEPRGETRYLGPVVVLTSVQTSSAAEDFVVALHASKRAKVVGGRTRGSTGQPLRVDLPGGGARICTKWDTYPDGREFVGVGIIPDVEVHPTPKDIAAGRDVVLEKGIEVLKSKLM